MASAALVSRLRHLERQREKVRAGIEAGAERWLTRCDGCLAWRLCRKYRGMYLCCNGPNKCWRRRRVLYEARRRKAR